MNYLFALIFFYKQWGAEEIQFTPELWRFEREKGGWEPQSAEVRKGGEFLTLRNKRKEVTFIVVLKPGCFFCYWFGFQQGVVARG